MENKFWKWAKAESGSELILEGVIASDSWYEDDVTPKVFRDELAQHPGAVTVRINSPGGDVSAGVSIYNMLNEHEGEVTVKVDGIAASIASLIAMAGDKIVMLPGSMMMVHLPWTIAAGNSDDMAQVVEMLQKTGESMIPIYAARTGLSEERVEELLKAETWMTAEDAVELGFADEAIGAKSTLAQAMAKIREMTSSMQSAVMQPVMSLQAKDAPEEPPTPPTEEESNDTDSELSATETADETPETDSESEATETETSNSDEGTKAMSKQDDAAREGIQAAAPANPVVATAVNAKDWFKSRDAVEAFTMALADNPGKSFNDEEVQASYRDLQVKAGITDPSVFTLPEPVITSIEDAVTSGEIYSRLNHTGLDIYKTMWDSTDPDVDTSRAGGFNPAYEVEGEVDRTKEEQVLAFNDRVIRAQYIYKYLVLGKEVIRENRTSGALVRFVLNELPVRVIRELERAAIIGDGRAAGNKRKITSFVSVKSDTATVNSPFASTYTRPAGVSLAEAVRRAADLIEAEGEVVLIAKKGFRTEAQFEKDADGKLLFPIGTSAEAILGVSTIIEPTWFNDSTDPDNDAYLVVLSQYRTVGDNSVEAFTNFKLETNEQQFLQEIYKGGALSAMKSAVAISAESES